MVAGDWAHGVVVLFLACPGGVPPCPGGVGVLVVPDVEPSVVTLVVVVGVLVEVDVLVVVGVLELVDVLVVGCVVDVGGVVDDVVGGGAECDDDDLGVEAEAEWPELPLLTP